MILHDVSRSARAGKLHVFAAVALFVAGVAGCAEPLPGKLLVKVAGDTMGAGGSDGAGTGAGGEMGSGGAASASTGGAGTQESAFLISLDTTSPQVDLDDKLEMTVTLSPAGYVGPVSLAVNDLGNGGITADLAQTTVTLDGSTAVMVKLTLTTMSSTPPGNLTFNVSGAVETGASSVSATLTVKPAITIVIPKGVYQLGGTKDNPYKMAFGDYPMNLIATGDISDQHPLTVRFFNDDDMAHQIHAGNPVQGFAHDPADIAPHSMDGLVRKINAKGLYDFYLHDQNGAATIGRLAVQ